LLGVNDEGHLHVPGSLDATGEMSTVVIRFFHDGAWHESTAFGAEAEGFGVSAKRISDGSSFWAGANANTEITALTPAPLITDGVSATAVATTSSNDLRIEHKFEPSPYTENAYQVTVTYEDISTVTLTDLRYRRAVDWDIPPTVYNECVSIFFRSVPEDLEYTSDGGFVDMNPLINDSDCTFVCPGGVGCPVYDNGPADHGAMFQFIFKGDDGTSPLELGPGKKFNFKMFYGAAATKTEVDSVLTAVGAEIASIGYPSTSGKCLASHTGGPNVFFLALSGVGGSTIMLPHLPTIRVLVLYQLQLPNQAVSRNRNQVVNHP